jgi:hypothetical protein
MANAADRRQADEQDDKRSGPEPDDLGNTRGNTELILGVLAAWTLVPFLQSVAGQAGSDVYQAIRGKLSRHGRKQAEAEIRESGTVTLADPGSRVILQIPQTMTPVMALRLKSLRLPAGHSGWLLVVWDAGLAQWLVEKCTELPPSANLPD